MIAVLQTAKAFGIKYVVYKALGNSKVPPGVSTEYPAIMDFNELM